jgi:hypothetical protein
MANVALAPGQLVDRMRFRALPWFVRKEHEEARRCERTRVLALLVMSKSTKARRCERTRVLALLVMSKSQGGRFHGATPSAELGPPSPSSSDSRVSKERSPCCAERGRLRA